MQHCLKKGVLQTFTLASAHLFSVSTCASTLLPCFCVCNIFRFNPPQKKKTQVDKEVKAACFYLRLEHKREGVLNEWLQTDGQESDTMQPFSPLCFLWLSAHTDLFSQLWITGALIKANSRHAVNHNHLWFEENPVVLLKFMIRLRSRLSFSSSPLLRPF